MPPHMVCVLALVNGPSKKPAVALEKFSTDSGKPVHKALWFYATRAQALRQLTPKNIDIKADKAHGKVACSDF